MRLLTKSKINDFYLLMLENIITKIFAANPDYDNVYLSEVFQSVPPLLMNIDLIAEATYLVQHFGEGAVTKLLDTDLYMINTDISVVEKYIIIRDKWEKRHGTKH
jgi:hypothetical protein